MSPVTLDLARLQQWMTRFAAVAEQNKAYLTALDSAIGDADHGTNMARGSAAVLAKLEASPPSTMGELGKTAGMTLVSAVGGSAGPLYGTFFLRLGASIGDAAELDAATLAAALRAGVEGIVARGKAEAGDKTMVDAWLPALAAMDEAVASGASLVDALAAARDAAAAGRDATEPLVARKGRASYLGERSAGHIDPGAASTALLLDALAEVAAA
ncbi:dihydroxyacetone kinase subunit DhaL [Microcella daejeonensis]|uniref:Dihydroxyacetone kinase subunit DhaL n=1 Tax=Microcella daejeonensis TaxID=2994971 RepID=A0A9E8MIT0_9MICO|nr:dihydroxyacetone kinase subunit DhaL [Microcella daejeonensis]WAB80313.1 dihydroxyacetone kinase subunit DhaL [Microcella daejeonensis]